MKLLTEVDIVRWRANDQLLLSSELRGRRTVDGSTGDGGVDGQDGRHVAGRQARQARQAGVRHEAPVSILELLAGVAGTHTQKKKLLFIVEQNSKHNTSVRVRYYIDRTHKGLTADTTGMTITHSRRLWPQQLLRWSTGPNYVYEIVWKQIQAVKLKLLSKLIRIFCITFCYTQLCGGCLVNMTPVVSGNTLRICTIISEIH